MADIDVERKGPSIWPWIIGLIILALLIWLLAEWLGDDDAVVEEPVPGVVEPAPVVTPPVTDTLAGPAAGGPAAFNQFVQTCPGETQEMSMDHQYMRDCVQRLVESLDAVLVTPGVEGVDVQAQMQEARQAAQRLAETPETSPQHANMARNAFTSVATVINAAQDQRYPNLEQQANQVQESAQAVSTDTPLLEQRDAVNSFFRSAADALRGMAGTPPM